MADSVTVLNVGYKNRNPFFPPVGGPLAGEMNIQHINLINPPGYLNRIGGVLPGYQIRVSVKDAYVEIVDRLKLPENAALMDQIREVLAGKEVPEHIGDKWKRDPAEACSTGRVELSTGNEIPNNLATWLFHIRRLFDAGRLQKVSGPDLPSMEEIRTMGVVWKGDASGRAMRDGKSPNLLYPPKKAVPQKGASQ